MQRKSHVLTLIGRADRSTCDYVFLLIHIVEATTLYSAVVLQDGGQSTNSLGDVEKNLRCSYCTSADS